MKEDLGMYGTQYNLATTCFQVGKAAKLDLNRVMLTKRQEQYSAAYQRICYSHESLQDIFYPAAN